VCSSWGRTWTPASWCETRNDFSNFWVDRMTTAEPGEKFKDRPGQTLRDMMAQSGAEAVRMLDR